MGKELVTVVFAFSFTVEDGKGKNKALHIGR